MISSHLLFFVSALGAVNGIFLALYLFGRRPQRLANAMLGALLLAISIRTGKSAFYDFNPDLAVEFLQFGLSACLLIGPLTYLYVHSFLAAVMQRPVDSGWRRHLALSAILIGAGLAFPYSRFPAGWYYVICGMHAYWFIYLLLAGRELWRARAMLRGQEERMSRTTMLLLSVYLSSLLILVAYVLTPMTSYIVGALSFTFSVHVTVLNMELVAERSGFNSTSTFFAAFKKIAGQTPASYRALAVPASPA